jgi:hypothetical protein
MLGVLEDVEKCHEPKLGRLIQIKLLRLIVYHRSLANFRRPQCVSFRDGLAQHSDQVLNAILSMAGRQDLLLARKIEDLRQKVFDLADVMGRDV